MARALYFAPGILHEHVEAERFMVSWYASVLEAMSKEPLYSVAPDCPTIQSPYGWEVVGKVTDGLEGITRAS